MTVARALTVEALERAHPEWSTWLRLTTIARRAAGDPAWAAAVPSEPPGDGVARPLIAGAVFAVEARAVVRLVGALIEARALTPETAVRVLDAAVAHDTARFEAVAEETSMSAERLRGVAPLVALPLLQACGRAWSARIPSAWRRGACPVCGAWAMLAEARGVERTLRLRCARCGGDWATAPLHCPFCGEQDHEKLRALVGEAKRDLRGVEACATCKGYVKTVTTLAACAPLDVGLLDLATVDLDVAALEHGYTRPAELDAPLDTRVTTPPARGLRALFGA